MRLALRHSLGSALVPLLALTALCFPLTAQSPAPHPPAAATPAAPLTPAQQLAADTAKLQDLAAELKAAMEKSTKDTLSFAVIKKAQEVEKLAHKVHDEMRDSLLHGS